MTLLVSNIKRLVHTTADRKDFYSGSEMSELPFIDDAWLLIQDDKISSFGKTTSAVIEDIRKKHPGLNEIDATGKFVFPSWCDSHTHLVYTGSRENEFADRIRGLSYQEIYERGGGILNSSRALRSMSEDDLFNSSLTRIHEIMRMGTGAVEIKSGYGLSVESELKMLRVISRLSSVVPIPVKATLLAAHALPEEYKNDKEGYLKLIIDEMIPAVASEKLADYIDIFCEKDYFTPEDALRMFDAAAEYGLQPKVHAEQLSHSGGIAAGVRSGAISVDHLEFASDEDISLLKNSRTMAVVLPGAQLFLGLQNPPVRKMISSGLPVAISSDFNPGSCPSGNMNQMVSLACIMYRMLPEEAIIAATSNSAYAMGLGKTHGSITAGKQANIFITEKIPSFSYLPYYFGKNVIETVVINGKVIN